MDRQQHSRVPLTVAKRDSKVVSFRTDAAFFYERGVKYLERNDLKKALKAFRRTVEVEPQNPVNHCNLAGVLSELGDFEASNEVLLRILNDIDPSMYECQFYLANNYANMGQYQTAEEYVLRYLDADPEGEYAEDAEEMLGVLMDEFGGGQAFQAWEAKRQEEEQVLAQKDGRHLLEEGQFEAAVEWLESIVERDPSNTAAYNNLSLAYYYTGQHQRAIETAERVLDMQPHNVHAMCNLTVFVAQLGPKDQLASLKQRLAKMFPLHYDQAMKIGTTLGLVGDHESAYQVFRRLLRVVERPEPTIIHSMAAAAANVGRFGAARRWWKMLTTLPDMADIAVYYLSRLDQAERDGQSRMRVSYQYDYPLHVQFAKLKNRLDEGDIAVWQSDPLLRASLYWGLRHGNIDTKRAVIRTLSLIGDADAERALRLFLKRPDIDDSVQFLALYALKRVITRGTVDIHRGGADVTLSLEEVSSDVLLKTDATYEVTWERIERALSEWKKADLIPEAKRVWVAFLADVFQKKEVRIVKPSVWAAGVAYLVLRDSGETWSQNRVAEAFRVSVSSVSKAANRIAKGQSGNDVH